MQSRGDKIRTCDLLVPNQALYQAEPHPEFERYHCNTAARLSQARPARPVVLKRLFSREKRVFAVRRSCRRLRRS